MSTHLVSIGSLHRQNYLGWYPHEYQKKSVQFLISHPCAALFQTPGLGKTAITLAAIKILKERGMLNKVLVIAPLRVCYSVWPAELRKWANFNGLTFSILHGPKKEYALLSAADIYLINPEGLQWLLNSKAKRFSGFDTLVIDESSKFKERNTIRFRLLKQVLSTFKRRWILTGSPIANSMMNIWSQLYILDQGAALGKYITNFRLRFFEQDYSGYNWLIKPGADQAIYQAINHLVLTMKAEDYIDLPALVENTLLVELPSGVRKIYDDLEKTFIAAVKDKVVVASNAAALSTKLRQVANGGIYLAPDVNVLLRIASTNREYISLHDAKTDVVSELVDELQGSPLLVVYEFLHDLDRLKRRFGKDVPYLGGGTSTSRSEELIQQWNAKELPLLLLHPQSAAHGINLQHGGNHICFYGLPWSFENYDQVIRRIYRQGQIESVFVHHIIANKTIDHAILKALKTKSSGQAALFDALKEYIADSDTV